MSDGSAPRQTPSVSRRGVLRAAGLAGTALTVGTAAGGRGPAVEGEWPTYRAGPANTGWTAGSDGVAVAAKRRWTAEADLDVSGLSVRGGTLYLALTDFEAGTGAVRALDAETGEREWAFETDRWSQATPVVGSDRVYALSNGDGEGAVFALSTSDGRREWSRKLPEEGVGALTVVDGTVYVGDVSGAVVALAADTGDRTWQSGAGGRIWSPPAVVDGTVYVTIDGGDPEGPRPSTVRALDAATGDRVWQYEVESARTTAAPAVAGDTVYVGDENGRLHALATDDGRRRFRFEATERVLAPPVVHDGTVYLSSADALYALEGETGSVRWQLDADSFASSPVGTTDALYASVDGHLTAVDAGTGAARRLLRSDAEPVVIARDTLYLESDGGVQAVAVTDRARALPTPTPSPTVTETPSPTRTDEGTTTATPAPTESGRSAGVSTDATGATGAGSDAGTTSEDGALALPTVVAGVLTAGGLCAARDRRRTDDE